MKYKIIWKYAVIVVCIIIVVTIVNIIGAVIILMQSNLLAAVAEVAIIIPILDIMVAIVFGYIFSRKITRPIKEIIRGVENLEEGKYEIFYKEEGIYKDVKIKLNNLANKLEQNKIEKQKIDKLRDEWIANITHDIKTPLSSIKGYAEVLEYYSDFTIKEIKEYGKIVNEKSEYIKEIVDDLNLTMQLKNNKYILKNENINLVSLVKEIIIDILNDSKYSERDIEFISIKDVIKIDVDKMLLRRAINNLIYNAIIHNNDKVSIKVNIYKLEKVHIVIEDNGKGIAEEDLKHIFDRYYRGTNTIKEQNGSGLGMAIAENIIKAHDGDININSKLGVGTEIEIIL